MWGVQHTVLCMASEVEHAALVGHRIRSAVKPARTVMARLSARRTGPRTAALPSREATSGVAGR